MILFFIILVIWNIVLHLLLKSLEKDVSTLAINAENRIKKLEEQTKDLYYLVKILKRDKLPKEKPTQEDWLNLKDLQYKDIK